MKSPTKYFVLCLLLIVVSAPLPTSAQPAEVAAGEATHQQLRKLRDELMVAINDLNIESMLPLLHTNIVITWHNAEVSRGHDGIREYFDRVMTGPDKLVESYHCSVAVDELTVLFDGDTGISFGSTDEHFGLVGGKQLNVKGRWTATLIKQGDRWLVASLHASTNLFDNVLLSIAKKTIAIVGVFGFAAGCVLFWCIARRRHKKV